MTTGKNNYDFIHPQKIKRGEHSFEYASDELLKPWIFS